MRAATLVMTLLATAALAQDRPPAIFPTRDVAVAYRTTDNQTINLAWHAGGQLMRVDAPQGAGAAIIDQARQTITVVMDAQRIVMQMPFGAGAPGMPNIPMQPGPNARFTREGQETVAGLACTVWRYQEDRRDGRACITADGVLLRAMGSDGRNNTGGITATEVRYGPQDPARFRAPAGYQTMDMQQMMQGMGQRPPAR